MTPVSATSDRARLDLVRLGQADRPWEFLTGALAWLREQPEDHGVRFLAATNAASLGLRTFAIEFLKPLPPEAAADERVAALARQIESLPDDEFALQTRLDNARRGVAALADRGIDLVAELRRWEQHASNERWFSSIDGNLVRCTDAVDPLGSAIWLNDLQGAARAFCQSTVACDAYTAPPPFVVEGINPPWILTHLHALLTTTRTGYRTAMHLVQSDPAELLDGLACTDLHDVLSDPRVLPHVGPNAGEHLRDSLDARLKYELPGRYVLSPTTRTTCTPPANETLHAMKSRQVAALAGAAERAQATYATRDASWWRQRFAQIESGRGEPLRVLLISSRFTTFVQHAASDLAHAVREAGGESRLLIEPDNSTRMSRLSHVKAVADFRPDLLVMINYTRAHLGDRIPRNLPVVCWIQDTMAHLFDPATGAAQGPFDVLLGNHHHELFQRHGFDFARYLHAPVAVSQSKFHPGPCMAEHRRRFECEIAYVSHHAETPEQMLARLQAEAGPSQNSTLLDAVLPIARSQVTRLADEPIRAALRSRLEELVTRHLGQPASPHLVSQLLDQVAIPLAERIVRHETLRWAAEIAESRGWTLRLFGTGWESHPTLAAHASGPLAHGDELRACYQLAAVHLHASVSPLTHQRLMECALSGGFPLARLNHDALNSPERLLASVGFRPAPENPVPPIDPDLASHPSYGDRARLRDHAVGYRLTDHPALLRRAAQLQRLRLAPTTPSREEDGDVLWCDPRRVRMDCELRGCGLLDWNAATLFGNLADHTFTDRDSFESMLVRAVEDPGWRASRSDAMAERIKSHATHSAMLRRVLGWFPSTL